MGCIDVGIAAMAWAPDQELVVLVNCAGSLLVMTREFDVLSEAPIETDEFGAAAPINVGWGRRETQFQGKVRNFVTVRIVSSINAAIDSTFCDHVRLFMCTIIHIGRKSIHP